jgi:hypothetical protein
MNTLHAGGAQPKHFETITKSKHENAADLDLFAAAQQFVSGRMQGDAIHIIAVSFLLERKSTKSRGGRRGIVSKGALGEAPIPFHDAASDVARVQQFVVQDNLVDLR